MFFPVGFIEKFHYLKTAFVDVKVDVAPFKVRRVSFPDLCFRISCFNELPCFESNLLIDKFSEILKIKAGETTEDGLFTLEALRCIGACGIAPALTINGKVYPKVQVSDVPGIVDEYLKMGGAN